MELSFFVKGLVIGFSIAAPVGPIGVLCIRRTLAKGMMSGFISGIGTATADAIYGCIAAFGITAVTVFSANLQPYLRFCGGIFLLYLGYGILSAKPPSDAVRVEGTGVIGDYLSAFFLTLTNPMTILSFAAVFAGLGIGETGGNFRLALLMVCGVFAGSVSWWLILAGTANLLRSRFGNGSMKFVNRLSGSLIICFGILSILSL